MSRITITQVVRCWGIETSAYETGDVTLDEIRAQIVANDEDYEDATSIETVESWMIQEWLDNNVLPEDGTELVVKEITDRGTTEIEEEK
jgi:hypothetical protein